VLRALVRKALSTRNSTGTVAWLRGTSRSIIGRRFANYFGWEVYQIEGPLLMRTLSLSEVVVTVLRVGLRSKVAKNAASLYIIQFANYIVPLIMVPYLVRVLGPAGYGSVAFAQGFINYLMLFVEYGFDWSATRKISVMRDDLAAVSHVALHVWAAKGLFSLVGLVMLGALTFVVPKLREVAVLLFALYGLVLGNALFPTWLFQGMERMVTISVINLGMKLGILAGVFLLVKRPEDAVLYAGLLGGGSLLAGLTGALVALRMFRVRLIRVSATGVWEALREGWTLFLSKASVSLYTAGNAFILGMLTNHAAVGYYSVAEKIVRSILGLLDPISQAIYPRLSKLFMESKDRAFGWVRRTFIAMAAFGLVLSMIVYSTSGFIVRVLLGSQYEPSMVVMRALSALILLVSMNHCLTIGVIFPLRMEKAYLSIVCIAAIINLSLALVFVPIWSAFGMAVSVVLTEIFVTIVLNMYLLMHYVYPLVEVK